MIKNKFVQPFLKWAGGKRALFHEIKKRVPKSYSTYYEPFLGGGAVLFSLQPKKAVVNDINSEIINVYRIIKTNVEELIKELKKHKNDSDYFYKIRDQDRNSEIYKSLTDVQKAARIIFLNKTCFNGLFRVNSQGQFNAPFGRYKNPNILNEEVLRAVKKYLNENKIEILNGNFDDFISKIKKGSFVYLDPPYDPVSSTASFTGYNLDGFGKQDQIKLKEYCDKLNKKGVKFLLSNSATDFIKELYKDYTIEIVEVPRNINSVGSKRGKVDEVLIRNYDIE
ncbi:MAG: DNA adenine methylase [Nanoarchaeota archaeon]|nr:DNA adenine methylase [Nanoarchaeota archaeon]